MTRDKIKEGDICTLDESVAYSYNPHKPYEVVVLWHGVNSQPLVTKLDEYKPFWTTYSQLIEVKRHIDLSIKALEQQTCDDAVSRQAVLDVIFSEPLYKTGMKKRDAEDAVPAIFEKIKALPPVNPQRTGHWIYDKIDMNGYYLDSYECSVCKGSRNVDTPYCPDCGAKMVDKEINNG